VEPERSVLDWLLGVPTCSSAEVTFSSVCKSGEGIMSPSGSIVRLICWDSECLAGWDASLGVLLAADVAVGCGVSSDGVGRICVIVGVVVVCSKGNSMPKIVPFPNSLCTLIWPFIFLT